MAVTDPYLLVCRCGHMRNDHVPALNGCVVPGCGCLLWRPDHGKRKERR